MSEDQINNLLIKITSNNDLTAFKQIYIYYYDRLVQLANSLIKHTEAAEEVVDDVFLKIWLKRESLKTISNLTVYLYVAIKNQSLNHISRNQSQNSSLSDLNYEIRDITLNAEEKLISTELLNKINQTIQQMSPQCKLVFKLVKEDGLKYKEVAEILNISVKTVEYHVSKALKQIAEKVSANTGNMVYEPLKKYAAN